MFERTSQKTQVFIILSVYKDIIVSLSPFQDFLQRLFSYLVESDYAPVPQFMCNSYFPLNLANNIIPERKTDAYSVFLDDTTSCNSRMEF